MTLLPCPDVDVSPADGLVESEPELVCCVPGCTERWALETHHVVRRTALGGSVRHVAVRGTILLNERKICPEHHLQVTGGVGGHKAWIRYVEGDGWVWYVPIDPGDSTVLRSSAAVQSKTQTWLPVGPLKVVM